MNDMFWFTSSIVVVKVNFQQDYNFSFVRLQCLLLAL